MPADGKTIVRGDTRPKGSGARSAILGEQVAMGVHSVRFAMRLQITLSECRTTCLDEGTSAAANRLFSSETAFEQACGHEATWLGVTSRFLICCIVAA
jgi:hypothetical protein